MKYKLKENTYLTTDSSQSSYGIPAILVNGQPYGPSDSVNGGRTAADIVAAWASQSNRTQGQINAASAFLAQWPNGPQIGKTTKVAFRAMIDRDLHRKFNSMCVEIGSDMTCEISRMIRNFIDQNS